MEKERLKYTIDRFDHYYDSVNNKGSVFLGLSTFIVGGLIAAYSSFLTLFDCTCWIQLLMVFLIVIGLAIMLILISALTPFIPNVTESVFNFGSIAQQAKIDFEKKSESMDDEAELKDLRSQVHELSTGLKKKFSRIRLTAILFTIQFILFIPLIILVISNYKK